MPVAYQRTKKIQLVLFGGKALSGKTTSANYIKHKLVNNYPGLDVLIRPLAQPIKDLAMDWFDWDGKKDDKGRKLLQVLGTDAGRAYNENLWVKKLEDYVTSTIFPPSFVLVDDWRFDNERSYFKNNRLFEVTSIAVVRGSGLSDTNSSHISENSLPDSLNNENGYYDFVIDNTQDIKHLENQLDNLFTHLDSKINKET